MSKSSNCKEQDSKGQGSKKAERARKNWKPRESKVATGQPRKDSKSKRVNYDNTREDKFEKDRNKPNANDITWYSKNPELLKSASSFPFNSVLGEQVYSSYSVPGIMVLPWCPNLGPDTIAVNQSFNSMYSFVVHANSRNYSYNAPDLGILTMAGAQVFSILGAMIRGYGVFKYYQERNMYVPDIISSSMGFTPSSLRTQLSQMWFDLNNLIDQTKQIWIPDVLPVVDRWFWLNTNLFTDAEGVMSQIYLFVQDRYFMYSETGSEHGGMLGAIKKDGTIYNPTGSTPDKISDVFNPAYNNYTWNQWVTVAQSMINALISSEDRGIIYGDLLNAYGAERIKSLPQIDSNFTIMPTYNAEVQTQVENYLPLDLTIDAFGQTQTNASIITCWHPQFYKNGAEVTTSYAGIQSMILNFHTPNYPTNEAVVVATRMSAFGVQATQVSAINPANGSHSSKSGYIPLAVGTEVPHGPRYIQCGGYTSSGLVWGTKNVDMFLSTMSDNPNLFKDYFRNMGNIMAFDWHPFFYEVTGDLPTSSYTTAVATYGDWDNYTKLNYNEIAKLHRVCAFSEFGVPHV